MSARQDREAVRAAATEALDQALANLADHGQRTPCQTEPGRSYWLSESRDERELAAGWCEGCPVLDLCGEAADIRSEAFGVWAGTDRSPRPAGRPASNTEEIAA